MLHLLRARVSWARGEAVSSNNLLITQRVLITAVTLGTLCWSFQRERAQTLQKTNTCPGCDVGLRLGRTRRAGGGMSSQHAGTGTLRCGDRDLELWGQRCWRDRHREQAGAMGMAPVLVPREGGVRGGGAPGWGLPWLCLRLSYTALQGGYQRLKNAQSGVNSCVYRVNTFSMQKFISASGGCVKSGAPGLGLEVKLDFTGVSFFIITISFVLVYQVGAGTGPSGEPPFLFFRQESSSHSVERRIENELLQENERLKPANYVSPPQPSNHTV